MKISRRQFIKTVFYLAALSIFGPALYKIISGKKDKVIPVKTNKNCLRCAGCVAVCPELALELESTSHLRIYDDRCIKCGNCIKACPVRGIS